MKKHIKVLSFILIALLVIGGIAGCASTSQTPQRADSQNEAAPAQDAKTGAGIGVPSVPAPSSAFSGQTSTPADLEGRKVVKTAQLTMESTKYDETLAAIYARINEFGGYIESSNENGKPPENWKDKGRSATFVVRVPEAKFLDFITGIEKLAKLTYRKTGGEDITSAYIDRETRVATLKIQLESLQRIMLKAEKTEDLIKLYDETARIQTQIESLTTELQRYDKLVSLSTVSLSLTEVKENVSVEPVSEDLGSKIGAAFNGCVNAVREVLEWIVIIFIGALPVLVVCGVITAAVLLIVKWARKLKRNKAKRKEDQNV